MNLTRENRTWAIKVLSRGADLFHAVQFYLSQVFLDNRECQINHKKDKHA